MKTFKKILTLSFAVSMVFIICTQSLASMSMITINSDNEPYEYPLTPGTETWYSYNNKRDIVSQLQIPEKKLAEMTTEALLETVLNYPYILDYIVFNDINDASEILYNSFNGFRELMSRIDITNVLLNSYNESKLLTVETYSEETSPEEYFYVQTIEYIIVSDMKYNGDYSQNEKIILNNILKEKNKCRQENELYSVSQSCLIEYDIQYQISSSQDYTYTVSYVYTPNNNPVEVWYDKSPEANSNAINNTNEYLKYKYGLEPIAPVTVKYNCHSYAWHDQSTSNICWMNDPSEYMTDGSYIRETGIPRSGMKLYWRQSDHSGIVSTITYENGQRVIYVTSKWAEAGLYYHLITNCPYSDPSWYGPSSIETYRRYGT